MKNNIIPQTEIEEQVDVLEETKEEESKKIVLYNDDYNSFDHVINCLVKYCKHTKDQAENCAHLVHHKGKCSVKEGDLDTLKPMKEALCENGLDAKIEQHEFDKAMGRMDG